MKAIGSQKAFKLEGIPEMKKTLLHVRKALSAEANVALTQQLHEILIIPADMIAQQARNLAPRRTGNLENAIHSGFGKGAAAWAAVDLKVAPYAEYIEKGTSRIPAQPYFRPAVASQRPAVARILAEKIPDLIERAADAEAWKASGF